LETATLPKSLCTKEATTTAAPDRVASTKNTIRLVPLFRFREVVFRRILPSWRHRVMGGRSLKECPIPVNLSQGSIPRVLPRMITDQAAGFITMMKECGSQKPEFSKTGFK
jgi:hypothetical protein